MMSRHFGLNSEISGGIDKRLPHAKNQLSAVGSYFNQFVTDIYRVYHKCCLVVELPKQSYYCIITTSSLHLLVQYCLVSGCTL